MIGVLLLIGASWLFGGIAADFVGGAPLTVTDKHFAEWFHQRTAPGLTAAMQIIAECVEAAVAWAKPWKRALVGRCRRA